MGDLPLPNAAHFLGTAARRARAAQSYQRTAELAAEGNPYYIGELFKLNVGFTTWAMCPWLWFAPDEPLGPLDWE